MMTKKEYAAVKRKKLPPRFQELVEKFWYERYMVRKYGIGYNESDIAVVHGCNTQILEYMIQHTMPDVNPEKWEDMFEHEKED